MLIVIPLAVILDSNTILRKTIIIFYVIKWIIILKNYKYIYNITMNIDIFSQ